MPFKINDEIWVIARDNNKWILVAKEKIQNVIFSQKSGIHHYMIATPNKGIQSISEKDAFAKAAQAYDECDRRNEIPPKQPFDSHVNEMFLSVLREHFNNPPQGQASPIVVDLIANFLAEELNPPAHKVYEFCSYISTMDDLVSPFVKELFNVEKYYDRPV
jgi:hypothetical protein